MRFETWIWGMVMLIQVTMIVFLLAQGRKDKSFRQAFYVFFVAVTVVDGVLVLWRPPSLGYQLDETIFGTYYESPCVEDPMVENFMAFKAPITSINDVTSRFIIPVFTHAQPLFLTAIAANRFTAICFPLKHAAIWSARRVAIVVFAIATCAVLLGAGTSVIIVIHQMVVCSSATAKEKEDLNCGAWWVFYQTSFPNALVISLSAVCCVACFALNIASITLMIVLRATGKLRQKAPELWLFIRSLFMFLLQMLVSFQDVVHILDNIELALHDFGIDPFSWDHPHSTEWLAGVKGTRMEIPGYGGVFIPGCTLEDPNEEYPLCSTWYRTLIGELCLREIQGTVHPDTKFTVRSLLQTLLAISGSAFLLVISGHVRNAYFKLYVGRLQRKQKQFSSSINVVQVAPARQPIVSSVGGIFSSP